MQNGSLSKFIRRAQAVCEYYIQTQTSAEIIGSVTYFSWDKSRIFLNMNKKADEGIPFNTDTATPERALKPRQEKQPAKLAPARIIPRLMHR